MSSEKKINYVNLEIKLDTLTEQGSFEGYASIFNNVDNNGDVVLKGAFTESLKKIKPKLLYQHDRGQPIGVFDEIREDEKGLYVKGRLLLEVSKARDVYALIKGGAISGISIGYSTVKARWDNENETRYLEEVNLFEVSIVTFPSNKLANIVSVKSEEPKNIDEVKSLKELEAFLKEKGLTQKEQKATISKTKEFSVEKKADIKQSQISENLIKSLNEVAEMLKKPN